MKSYAKIATFTLVASSAAALAWGLALPNPQQAEGATPAQSAEVPASPPALPVSVTEVRRVDSYQRRLTYSGVVEARREAELAFDRAGRVVEVLVDDGEFLEEGQLVAKLDTTRIEAQVKVAQARVLEARAILARLVEGPRRERIDRARAELLEVEQEQRLAQLQLKRREGLVANGTVSSEDFEVAERNAEVLAARHAMRKSALDELVAGTRPEEIAAQEALVSSLEAALAAEQVELDKCRLVAPFAGRVVERHIDEGTVVSAGASLMRFSESGQLELRVGISIETAGGLKPGEEHTVHALGQAFQARLKSILPEVDLRTRTATAIFELGDADHPLFTGEVVQLHLEETLSDGGFWLPTSALTRGQRGLWACYAVAAQGEGDAAVERRDVEVLYTSGSRVLVRGALAEGDRIIDSGLQRVVPGQVVRPITH